MMDISVSRRSRQGITLIEVVVYLGLLAFVTGLAFTAFYNYMDHSRRLRRNIDDVVRTLRAGERWRADVRLATGPLTLVTEAQDEALHIPQKNGEIVYLYSMGEVWRLSSNPTPTQPLLTNVKSSHVIKEARTHTTSWRWEVELRTREKKAQLQPLFTFVTASKLEGSQ